MNPSLVLGIIFLYFAVLIIISYFTSRNANTSTFFSANKQSPWFLVAFGMIGSSLSGVTFVSVPGWVATTQFTYLQLVLGYLLGYLVIGTVLMPLYYRLNLVSIYTYLEKRFGFWSYKTGATFFILSRTMGSALRLFLVATVLQLALFDNWNIPFSVTVIITLFLIWLYTFKGGIKTIVWTDTFQTLFMLLSVGISLFLVADELQLSFKGLIEQVWSSEYSKMFVWDAQPKENFFKQFFSGAFISIVMTGLDQDMMQKNLTCRNIGDAQKNMFWFSITLVFVNLLFLMLGAALYLYANAKGIAIPAQTDKLYPMLALNHFSTIAGICFILGIIAAAYSSADSALTALTTSFCIDILAFSNKDEKTQTSIRRTVHIGFTILTFLVIIGVKALNDSSIISAVFTIAGYTYGPLLGLYSFGLFTKLKVRDNLVPFICVASPILCYIIDSNSREWFNGYVFGFELLMLNGLITFLGLLCLSTKARYKEEASVAEKVVVRS
jgi:Na+/proline symporter